MAGTNRKRGGRTPRSRPRAVPTSPGSVKEPVRDAPVGIALYLGFLLLILAIGDVLSGGAYRGGVVSDEQQHLATLFGIPCAVVPGAAWLLRSRPMLLGLCFAALTVIIVPRWRTLHAPVTGTHVMMRLVAGLVACAAGSRGLVRVPHPMSAAPPGT